MIKALQQPFDPDEFLHDTDDTQNYVIIDPDGAIRTIVGEKNTGVVRLRMLYAHLKIEIKYPDLNMRPPGVPKIATLIRREFKFKGSPPALLTQLETYLAVHGKYTNPRTR